MNGVTPDVGEAVAVPLFPPLQETFVFEIVALTPPVMAVLAVALQLLASVTVTL